MRKTLLTAAIAVLCLVATMTGAEADWRHGHNGHHGHHGYHGYHHSQPWGHHSRSSHHWGR